MSRQQQRGGSEQLENYHLFESIGEGSFGRVRLWGMSLHGVLLKQPYIAGPCTVCVKRSSMP